MNIGWPFGKQEPEATFDETVEMVRRIAVMRQELKAAGLNLSGLDTKQLLRQLRAEKRASSVREPGGEGPE